MEESQTCPDCAGKGWTGRACADPDEAQACSLCQGRGTAPSGAECPGCHGAGRIEVRTVEQDECSTCHGTGVLPVAESF